MTLRALPWTRIVCKRDGPVEEIAVSKEGFCNRHPGSMTEASSLGFDGLGTSPEGQIRRRFVGSLGEDRRWPASVRPSSQLHRPYRGIEVGVVHHDSPRPNLLPTDQGSHGQRPGRGWSHHFPGSQAGWRRSYYLTSHISSASRPDVKVFWGYGLFVDKPGDFVKKPMSACTGREIMTEIIGHLRIECTQPTILETCTCIPCMMPFITSQFLRRAKGDRPHVVPAGSKNLAFIGQFCELPDDVVFTVEYSIRSAQTAVYSLLGLSGHRHRYTKGATIYAFSSRRSWRCTSSMRAPSARDEVVKWRKPSRVYIRVLIL